MLSDGEKRQRYDLTGSIDDSAGPHRHHSGQQGYTVFQSGQGFQFHFHFPGGGGAGSERGQDSIGKNEFFDRVLPDSHRKPYLLYFHHDFCFECVHVDRIWRDLKSVSLGGERKCVSVCVWTGYGGT